MIVLFFTACKFSSVRSNNEMDKIQAVKVMSDFDSLLAKRDINGAMSLCHPYFLAANDTGKVREQFIEIADREPDLTERRLDHWKTQIVTGLNSGSYYRLFYLDNYKNGKQMKVSIRLVKDWNNDIKIIKYYISPDSFYDRMPGYLLYPDKFFYD